MQNLLTRFRRDLHQIPELDRQVPETLAYMEAALAPLPCRLFHPIPQALCAFFDGGKGDTIGFRAELDALPIQEAEGRAYGSRHPGCMHACGHDGHMAMLLGLAHTWEAARDSLPHNLLLIFQPAEETTGGAADICSQGVLDEYRVSRIFGCHLWPGLPEGQAFARPGPMMARSSEVTLTIRGRSVHIANRQQGNDALLAGAEFLRAAYAFMDAGFPPAEPRVLGFGRMESGQVRNALSDHTRLEGTLRVFNDQVFAQAQQGLQALAEETAAQQGCQAALAFSPGYPPLLNDPALVALAGDLLSPLPAPSMTTDDFSFFAQARPSLFFFLGVGEQAAPLHNPAFDFNEAVLSRGLDIFLALARLP